MRPKAAAASIRFMRPEVATVGYEYPFYDAAMAAKVRFGQSRSTSGRSEQRALPGDDFGHVPSRIGFGTMPANAYFPLPKSGTPKPVRFPEKRVSDRENVRVVWSHCRLRDCISVLFDCLAAAFGCVCKSARHRAAVWGLVADFE